MDETPVTGVVQGFQPRTNSRAFGDVRREFTGAVENRDLSRLVAQGDIEDDDSSSDDESGEETVMLRPPRTTNPSGGGRGQGRRRRKRGGDESSKSKKTKGRVKIKMEFIDNKLRRYTTFSKRKTGIMKKAYELSTLTGTQVMLLVASETGHVYTFATRKLQPMITSETGKALIQTCLNSPDPAPNMNPHDQRMSATGFEETELSYPVNEEDGINTAGVNKETAPPGVSLKQPQLFTVTNIPGAGGEGANPQNASGIQIAGAGHTFPMTSYLPATSNTSVKPVVNTSSSSTVHIPMPTAGITTLVQAGAPIQSLSAMTPMQLQSLSQQAQLSQAFLSPQYKVQQPIVTSADPGGGGGQATPAIATAVLPTTVSQQSPASSNAGNSLPQGAVVFSTPQGMVYAATPTQLQGDGMVINYQSASPVTQAQQQQQPPPPQGAVQHLTLTAVPSPQTAMAQTIPIPIQLPLALNSNLATSQIQQTTAVNNTNQTNNGKTNSPQSSS